MRRRIFLLLIVGSLASAVIGQPVPKKYKKIHKYIAQSAKTLSGVSVYIQTPTRGSWVGTAGYANLNDRQPLNKGHIFSMASIGKMYNAVAALKLVEEGRLHLDDTIDQYLPREIIDSLPNASSVTIRHLLLHQSGWANYEEDPELNRLYLSSQLKLDTLSHVNALRRYAFAKKSPFFPGQKSSYSSTNFLVLSMIIDHVVPEGHTVYLRNLLSQHGYANTYYRQTPVNHDLHYYGDITKDGLLEDLTQQTIETTNWFAGDDGVYAPIEEAAHFLQDVVKGKIIGPKMLREMTTWDNPEKPGYGLGLVADKSFPYKFLFGHSGRGIGTTADLYYFPNQDITIAIFCNTGLRSSSPIFKKAYLKMRTRIIKKIFLI